MATRILLPLLLALSASAANAQFPIVGTAPSELTPLYSLSAGNKLMSTISAQNTVSIYNTDLSTYRTLVLPTLAPNETFNILADGSVTEALFDQDPSTIEYVLTYTGGDGLFGQDPDYHGVVVCREDGSILMTVVDSWYRGVFMAEGQAYLLLNSSIAAGPPEAPSTLYALPGSMACTDCQGMPWTSGGGMSTPPGIEASTGMVLAPNPATDEVLLWAKDQSPLASGTIRIFDGGGRIVQERSFQSTMQLRINVGALPAGMYYAVLESAGRTNARLPFSVLR